MGQRASDHQAILDLQQIDAILFDLDGVITKTAKVHATAWKQLFDAYLYRRATRRGETLHAFDIETDYRRYVDGKPRADGVRSFLGSRGIVLPEGQPHDPADLETVLGLGNAKDAIFLTELEHQGIEVYDTTITFIRRVKGHGLKVAVISSSKHCEEVLETAGLLHLFDARVDGVESERLGLQGKPAPDIFLEATKRLNVEPRRTAIVEDAISGVQAGRAGQFAQVIGLDRAHQAIELKRHGADVVVTDLEEVYIRNHAESGGE